MGRAWRWGVGWATWVYFTLLLSGIYRLLNAVLARLEFHLLSGSNNLVIRFTELARGSFSMLACDADPTDRVIGNSPCGPRKGGGAHAAGSTGDRNRRIEQRRDNSSAFYSFVYWPS